MSSGEHVDYEYQDGILSCYVIFENVNDMRIESGIDCLSHVHTLLILERY